MTLKATKESAPSKQKNAKLITPDTACKGKYKRSSSSNVTGTKSDGLRDWVKQDWRQVANPEKKCGEK